ncbi:MAG: flagellar basal body P-ring protein FlgI [Hyphomicrobiales bacterium]|nr:flagellar basal body P-ring protein FlgI [Hyphomicrobiales bacterium]
MIGTFKVFVATIACLTLGFAVTANAKTRIKDVATVQGIRGNQLMGYGLVVGLQGTGDSGRSSPFTEQSIKSMLDRMGINIRDSTLNARNVAAVVVTAELPPFAGKGARIDVAVSSLGDASSLSGGTLVMTALYGADDEVYSVAQGPLIVTGFAEAGAAETVSEGVPTSGLIPNGAIIEREMLKPAFNHEYIRLELINPDFSTSVQVADVINGFGRQRYGRQIAREESLRTVLLKRPATISATRFISEIGELMIEPDVPARVVIDESTGTIVIGSKVQISSVAVTHGNLTVRVTETPEVSQPLPFADGETVVTSETEITAGETGGQFAVLEGTDLDTLVLGLNRIGLKPRGIIAILQAIKSAGALQAELVVQ